MSEFYEFEEEKKRKIKREDIKELKIESKVFDETTLFNLYKLLSKGIITSVEYPVKEGKESVVLAGKRNEKWVAIKIYRTLHCDFRNMWKYLITDPRFFHVRKSRIQVINQWAKREFKNMKIAFNENVSCPEPIYVLENVLVMSFVGENGVPASRLIDVELENPEKEYKTIVDEMKKMAKANIIHGDLSPFNILYYNKPIIIDFSQGVKKNHPMAREFLERDVKTINKFFSKKGVNIDEKLTEKLIEILGI